MGAMRIAIVDDIAQERALFRARLDEALMKHGVQAEIVELERGETFLQAASQQPFFMGGTNGVEAANSGNIGDYSRGAAVLSACQPVAEAATGTFYRLDAAAAAGGVRPGWGCYRLRLSTVAAMAVLIPILMVVCVKTLRVSLWKTGSIALSICAAFSCINSFSRGNNAILVAGSPGDLCFCPAAGVMYILLCWLFVLMAWYSATHSVQALIQDDNFARTWYVF